MGVGDIGKVSKTLEEVKEVTELVGRDSKQNQASVRAETPFVVCVLGSHAWTADAIQLPVFGLGLQASLPVPGQSDPCGQDSLR